MDLRSFNPQTVEDLVKALEGQLSATAGDWWTRNSSAIEGDVRALAQAGVDTATALAEGRISPEDAKDTFDGQAEALKNTLDYAEYMTEALAQKLFDTAVSVVGWAVFNRTGINLVPQLVKP